MKKDKRPFIKRKVIFESGRICLYDDTVIINGKRRSRAWVGAPGVGAAVVLTDKNEIVLVRQYRYGIDKTLWEIPAGTFDKGERALDCTRRECEEETGYKPGRLESLGSYVTSPAGSSERVYLYLATRLKKTAMNPDPDEVLTVKVFPLKEVKKLLRTGRIQDAKSIIALYRFLDRKKR